MRVMVPSCTLKNLRQVRQEINLGTNLDGSGVQDVIGIAAVFLPQTSSTCICPETWILDFSLVAWRRLRPPPASWVHWFHANFGTLYHSESPGPAESSVTQTPTPAVDA